MYCIYKVMAFHEGCLPFFFMTERSILSKKNDANQHGPDGVGGITMPSNRLVGSNSHQQCS